MPKKKIPTKDEVFEVFVDELKDYGIGLNGDIEGFKTQLHKSFKKFLGKDEYKDKYLFEFIFLAVDDILDNDLPSQVSDNAPMGQAAE